MITTGIFGGIQSQFLTPAITVLSTGIDGLTNGVAEIGTQLVALENGEVTTGPVTWLVDGVPLTGETAPTLTVPASDGAMISAEINGVASVSYPIRYPLVQVIGTLANQTLTLDSGAQTLDASAAFSFGGTLGYDLIGAPTGVSVAGATGLITFDTDSAAAQTGTTITVRAFDAGAPARFAETSFTLTIEANITTPGAFTAGQWLILDAETGGDATLVVLALPDTGGTFLDILQYRLDGGNWTPIFGANSTGVFTLSDAFTDGVATDIEIRAVNREGPGPTSDVKSITTSAGSTDTTPPDLSVISYDDNTAVLTLDLIEESGAATVVWATADPSEDPSFTPAGGWSGTIYENGSINAPAPGTIPFTIPLTPTTPNGARELSIYAYDAAGNLSSVARVAFTATTTGDTTPPDLSVISYDDNTAVLTLDLIEESGAATVVWATADPSEDPSFTPAGGWSGTIYESGSISAPAPGTIPFTIPLTPTTPNGARELSIYAYDADDNLSAVERVAFTAATVATPLTTTLSDHGDLAAGDGVNGVYTQAMDLTAGVNFIAIMVRRSNSNFAPTSVTAGGVSAVLRESAQEAGGLVGVYVYEVTVTSGGTQNVVASFADNLDGNLGFAAVHASRAASVTDMVMDAQTGLTPPWEAVLDLTTPADGVVMAFGIAWGSHFNDFTGVTGQSTPDLDPEFGVALAQGTAAETRIVRMGESTDNGSRLVAVAISLEAS